MLDVWQRSEYVSEHIRLKNDICGSFLMFSLLILNRYLLIGLDIYTLMLNRLNCFNLDLVKHTATKISFRLD